LLASAAQKVEPIHRPTSRYRAPVRIRESGREGGEIEIRSGGQLAQSLPRIIHFLYRSFCRYS
jgi:hypothetical protein